MRVLLDACVPRRLGGELRRHDVRTAADMGWGSLNDGALLDAIGDAFDVLVTTDASLPKQQRLVDRRFGVIVLRAATNRLADLIPLVPRLRAAIRRVGRGQAQEIS